MKLYLRNPENFHPETLDFYKRKFEITDEEFNSEYIVINDFQPIKTEKKVACNSTGIDHIKAPEIVSLRGEDLSDLTAVAELCLGMAILLTRGKGEEIRGKTLGIIGYGRIGRKLIDYAFLLGMRVLTYDKNKLDMKLIPFLKESDIVSLHITADEENRNFFKKEYFEQMKNGAIFLNSARPWLVEEKGLKWALKNKLSFAWSDFLLPFEKEFENLICTDHLGGTTKESKQKSEMIIAKKLWQRKNTAN